MKRHVRDGTTDRSFRDALMRLAFPQDFQDTKAHAMNSAHLHHELVAAKDALLEVATTYREASNSLRDAVALLATGDAARASLAIDPHEEMAQRLLGAAIDSERFNRSLAEWMETRRHYLARLERLENARAAINAQKGS